jgi:abortive infection alpha-like protein
MADEKTPTVSGEIAAGVRQALGSIPEDLLGIAVGDWLREKRKRNQARLKESTRKILKERGVEPDHDTASPLLFIAICEAALDEDRPELQDLWARLLAAAVDAARVNRIRANFIEIVKQMEPLDALVLTKLAPQLAQPVRYTIAQLLGKSSDEVEVAMINLAHLNLIGGQLREPVETGIASLTSTGRELLKALY